jgi:hypothetical protein
MSMARKGRETMKTQLGWGLAVGVALFVAPSAWAKTCAQVCTEDLTRNTKLCKQHSKRQAECVQMVTQAKDDCLKECKTPSKEQTPPPARDDEDSE